jgi:hypothetical protein
MPDVKLVSPADLLFDAENPRKAQPSVGQRELWRSLASLLDRKLLRLAEDIVEYGIDPARCQSSWPLATMPIGILFSDSLNFEAK